MSRNIDDVRTRFDSAAADWDTNPGRVALARAVVDAIRTLVSLRPDMNVMDFGAGTGLVTLGLLPYVANLTAVDASGEMLRMLEQKLKALNVGNIRTLNCDIAKASVPTAEFEAIDGVSELTSVDHTLRMRVAGPITPVVRAAAQYGFAVAQMRIADAKAGLTTGAWCRV